LTFYVGQPVARAVYDIQPGDLNASVIDDEIEDEVVDEPMFLFQKVEIDLKVHNLFFDDGCEDVVPGGSKLVQVQEVSENYGSCFWIH
jgi:hypothetical protein